MFLLFSLLFTCFGLNFKGLIVDHDGGVDDVISLLLQVLSVPERVKAVSIVPADSYSLPDVWISHNLLKIFRPVSFASIPIGISQKEGTNLFPPEWREDSYLCARIPFWHNETSLQETDYKSAPSAVSVISKVLDESDVEGTDILVTGPLTNIADVLAERPELKKKIGRLYVMGGAVNVSGNVGTYRLENGRDGTAEWNIYNNPKALDMVLRSGVAATLVPLDATRYAPITTHFRYLLGNMSSSGPHYRVVHEALESIAHHIDAGTYYFWDTLTSLVALDPAIAHTEPMRLAVVLKGPSEGRTVRVVDAEQEGFLVDVATWADQKLFERTFLDILSGQFRLKHNHRKVEQGTDL